MSKQYHKVITDNNEAEKENANGLVYLVPVRKFDEQLVAVYPGLSKEHTQSLRSYAKSTSFKPEAWASFTLDLSADLSVAVAAIPDTFETFALLKCARKLIQALSDRKRQRLLLPLLPASPEEQTRYTDAVVSAVTVANYQAPAFGKKLDAAKKAKPALSISIYGRKTETSVLKDAASKAEASAHATNLVRELAMLPANVLDAKSYVKRAQDTAKKAGLKSEFWDTKKMRSLGAGAFVAVAQGSKNNDAGILRISYEAKGKKTKRACIVGKGIMFDTGGVNVKPGSSMFGMHGDMMGSAICLAVVRLAAEEKWPFSVDAYLAIAENSISEVAFRPNEIVIAANGLSIETVHTDAEGRMVLSDTLYFASKTKPDLVLDFATLTGSAIRAIGTNVSAAFTNRPDWHQSIIDAGKLSGERLWPFPLDEDYGECLESDIADTKQCRLTGGADHIEAAMFLQKFIEHKTPWIHIDLSAGEHEGGLAHVGTKETGFGVRVARELLFKLC